VGNARRDYSRVLEIDPVTLEVVWSNMPENADAFIPEGGFRIYSGFISSAQRLPNGNTLVTEGAGGRLLEVTPDYEIVWEYVSPYPGRKRKITTVYRAYRLPYDWVPQVEKPEEKAIPRLDNNKFRVPGSTLKRAQKTTRVKF
jgi:hypothetical protein